MQFKFAVALSLSHLSLVLGSPLVTSNEAIPGSAAKRDISLAIDKRTPVSALSKMSLRGPDAETLTCLSR